MQPWWAYGEVFQKHECLYSFLELLMEFKFFYISRSISVMFRSMISNGVQVTSTQGLSDAEGLWVSECFSLSAQTASIIQQHEVVDLEINFAVGFYCFLPTYQELRTLSGYYRAHRHIHTFTESHKYTNTLTHTHTHTHTHKHKYKS